MSYRRTTLVAEVLALLTLAMPLDLKCVKAADEPAAPRDEVTVDEVSFRHGDDTLSGSFYRPPGTGPHPAVVMILGSDRHDRDYGGVGPALGRHFGRAGIACLAWDKPGVGKSTGDYNTQTFRDRAEEALAAVRFLRGRKESGRTGSACGATAREGWSLPSRHHCPVTWRSSSRFPAGKGRFGSKIAVRVGAELRAAGFPEADVEQAVAFAEKRMDMIRGTGPYQELEEAQNAVKSLPWFRSVQFCDRALFEAARRNVGLDTTSWWPQVRCPVLVIYGDRDTSTGPPEPVVAIIRRGLEAAENRDITVRIFRDADHSILRSRTGRGRHGRRTGEGTIRRTPGPISRPATSRP